MGRAGICQPARILPVLQYLHEQHVSASLHDCQYRPLTVAPHDGVHLEVPEPFPVGLRRTSVYAYPVRYCHPLSNRPATVFQAVPAMLVEAALVLVPVLPDDGIDGFMRDPVPLPCKIAGNLLRRPLVPFQQVYGHVADEGLDGTVAGHPALSILSLPLSTVPLVQSACDGIAAQLTRYCRTAHSDSLGYRFFRTLPL